MTEEDAFLAMPDKKVYELTCEYWPGFQILISQMVHLSESELEKAIDQAVEATLKEDPSYSGDPDFTRKCMMKCTRYMKAKNEAEN